MLVSSVECHITYRHLTCYCTSPDASVTPTVCVCGLLFETVYGEHISNSATANKYFTATANVSQSSTLSRDCVHFVCLSMSPLPAHRYPKTRLQCLRKSKARGTSKWLSRAWPLSLESGDELSATFMETAFVTLIIYCCFIKMSRKSVRLNRRYMWEAIGCFWREEKCGQKSRKITSSARFKQR